MKIYILPSTCFCYYKKYPNNDKKICPIPSSRSTFRTDSIYLGTIQISRTLNEHYYYVFSFNCIRDLTNRRKVFSVLVTQYASVSHQVRTLKTNLLGLISSFSKYYFKTSTILLLSLSSHDLPLLNLIAIILLSNFEKW